MILVIDCIVVLKQREDSEPEPDPQEIIADPGGPKCYGSVSGTLFVGEGEYYKGEEKSGENVKEKGRKIKYVGKILAKRIKLIQK
jgi:hypothetical protein